MPLSGLFSFSFSFSFHVFTRETGPHRFSFYQRWFDTVFLFSGCVTAVTLLAFHLADRNSDADHHEEDYNGTAREAGGRRSKQS